MRKLLCTIFVVGLLASGAWAQTTITVPTDQPTVHAAVAAANTNDTVYVLNGTYTFTSTLNIAQAITLEGESETGVVFDIDTDAGYGIHPSVGGITLKNFTLNVISDGVTRSGYPIHASGTPVVQNGLVVDHVTIQGSGGGIMTERRAGLDIHGYDNVTLTYVTSKDATYGNGIQITGCTNVDVGNCTTSNNAWGSLSIYVSTPLDPDRACDDVSIDAGTCSFGENNVFIENQYGLVSTNVVVDGYDYYLTNDEFRTGAEGFIFIKDTLADVQAHALAAFGGFEGATALQEIATGEYVVDATLGIGMTIQGAIDAASPGDVISVGAGTFEEQLHITTENLTIEGAGTTATTVLSLVDLPLFYTTSADNYPIVFIDGVNTFTMRDLTVDGHGRGNANNRFQGVAFWNSGGTLTDVDVVDVIDTPFSGAQHGVGVYAYNDTGGPYTVNLNTVEVTGYQKGAIAMNGAGLTANVVGCTTTGAGPTSVTAQNGIQLYGGVGGLIQDCNVTGNIYTGTGWAASGILLISAGNVTIDGGLVTDGDPAVYCQDTSADVDGLSIANPNADAGNGFYVRIESGVAKAGSGDLVAEADPSPFGDVPAGKDLILGTATVTLDQCAFVGNGVAYGVAASNYVATDLISLAMTNCEISNWGWGVVGYGSGGDIAFDLTDNGIFGNGGYFYADAALTSTQDASGNYWGETDPAVLASGVFNGDIDYTPWLGGGTDLMPGFTGDFFTLWVDDDGAQIGGGRIAEALGLVSGSTINLAPGNFTEPAQLVIGTDVNLIGAGSTLTTLAPGFNTSGGSYTQANAFIYVGYGVTALIKDLAIDGAGWNIWHGIQSRGADLTVQGCELRNIDYSTYYGRGILFLTGTGLVKDCTMSNVKRIGVHVRGFVEPTAPVVAVDGLDYTGKGDGDWLDYGVEFGGGGSGTVTNSVITGCTGEALSDGSTSAAILVTDYYGTGTTADITDSELTGNTTGVAVGYDASDISQVTIHGSDLSGNASYGVSSTGITVDALNNWWGAPSGPYHPTTNPLGTGPEVTDNVLYNPWIGGGAIAAAPASATISCGVTETVTVSYTPGNAGTPALRGYTITVAAGAELSFLESNIADLDPFNGLGSLILFDTIDNLDGTVTVDCAIAGSTTGLTSAADLFSFDVTAQSEGVASVDLLDVILRTVDNQDIPAMVTGSTTTVDCTAPPAPTGYAAAPGPNMVRLSWDAANPADGVDHYELWRAVWHIGDDVTSAYPEYDDVNGPVTRQDNYYDVDDSPEWELVTIPVAGTASSFDLDVGLDRGIYWYELFAVDAAGNVSPMTAEYVRATNYFLGDFQIPAGAPGPEDISWFGSAYGTIQNTGDTYADTDIGPTDDFTGLGIPTTDNVIGFEDLMIIALNYQNVSKQDDIAVPATIALKWTRLDQDTWALELNEPCEGLLGLNVRAPLPEGVSVTVERGELLDQQGTPAFLATAPDGLDIGVAALGQGFTGQGELLRVTAAGVEELSPAIDARGHDNAAIDVALTTSAADLPSVLALNQNHPNPFNPSTTIKFDLPQRGRVDLKVYAVDGSLVRTLVSEVMDPGRHDVIWLGRDDTGRQAASGTYFYRMVADGKTLVRKMTLMK